MWAARERDSAAGDFLLNLFFDKMMQFCGEKNSFFLNLSIYLSINH